MNLVLRPFVLVLAFALTTLASAAGLPPGVTRGPSVEGITQYQLKNGLTVLLFPDATKPVTTVNITYLVGSRQENYGETGMAHLLEHMLFKGTPSIPNVFAELGRRGMQFNGSTFFDRTNYHETFPASEESLAWALRMEAERMTRATFTKAELDSEMTVVRNEYESGENDPQDVLWKRVEAVAFDWHNYAHPTIGARSDIENVPFEKLRAYYAMYYQPDNAVLVVAGKFDPDRTLGLIANYFGVIPRPTRVLPKFYTVEPVQDGERSVVVRRVGSEQVLGALFRTVPAANPDSTAFEALGEIMTIEPAGRLYRALVETHLATEVDAWNFDLRDPGFIIFWAHAAASDPIAPVRDGLLATLYGVKKTPIEEDELARVRTKALSNFERTINDPAHLGVALSEAIAQGDWRLFFIQRDRWRVLKVEDVQRVATDFIKPANLTLGEFIPDAKPDRAPEVAAADIASVVAKYRGDPAVAAGETFDATPANLEARTERFKLANGMSVALLSKKTRGASVRFALQLDYGDVDSLANTAALGPLSANMLGRGTTVRNRQKFEDSLDRLRAKLAFSGGGGRASASGETVRPNLAETLRLMAEALRTPGFAASEFETVKRERLAALEQTRTDPESIANRAIARHDNPYPPSDIRYAPTLDEEIAAVRRLTLDDVRAYYAKFFGASHGEIAIVGDFDAAETKALLEELFGAWTNPTLYARVPEPYHPTTPALLTFQTPDKANAALIGELALPMNDEAADYAALQVADRVLGGSTESRLFLRVRVKDGLSYGVGTLLENGAPRRSDFHIGEPFLQGTGEHVADTGANLREVLRCEDRIDQEMRVLVDDRLGAEPREALPIEGPAQHRRHATRNRGEHPALGLEVARRRAAGQLGEADNAFRADQLGIGPPRQHTRRIVGIDILNHQPQFLRASDVGIDWD